MVTQFRTQILWLCGRLSSEILPMELRLWLIITLVLERPNGVLTVVSLCCCQTVWMGKELSIVLQELKDFCNFQMKITTRSERSELIMLQSKFWTQIGKLSIVHTQQIISTLWEDNWEEISESLWSLSPQRNYLDINMPIPILINSQSKSDLTTLSPKLIRSLQLIRLKKWFWFLDRCTTMYMRRELPRK